MAADKASGRLLSIVDSALILAIFSASARTFAPRFLQTPPRDDALALR
jgi:hypothetical protein